MNGNEACIICLRIDSDENLSAWFVHDRRVLVHLDCWLAWYEQRIPPGRAPRRDSRPRSRRGSEEASWRRHVEQCPRSWAPAAAELHTFLCSLRHAALLADTMGW